MDSELTGAPDGPLPDFSEYFIQSMSFPPTGGSSGREDEHEHTRAPLPGIEAAWECVKQGEWSVWDLFTV